MRLYPLATKNSRSGEPGGSVLTTACVFSAYNNSLTRQLVNWSTPPHSCIRRKSTFVILMPGVLKWPFGALQPILITV